MTDLSGMVAVVTGAAGGIGRSFSRALSNAGASVMCADINEIAASEFAEELRSEGFTASSSHLDQVDEVSCEEMIAKAAQDLGAVGILINNAAAFSSLTRKPALDIEPDEWRQVIDINLTGPYLCSRAAMPGMLNAGYGKVVNIASSSVFRAENRLAHYVSAKIGVIGLTRALAREYSGGGVTINALSPGATDSGSSISTPEYLGALTEARSIGRVQVPSDLVGALLFLSSTASDFMTGQHMVVDGGSEFV